MKIISDKDLAVFVGGSGKVIKAGEPKEVSEVVGLAALQLGAKIYNENSVTPQEIEDALFCTGI